MTMHDEHDFQRSDAFDRLDLPDHEHGEPGLVIDTMAADGTRLSREHLPADQLTEADVEFFGDPALRENELHLHMVGFERWPAEARAAFYWLCVLLPPSNRPWSVFTADGRFEDVVEAICTGYRPHTEDEDDAALEEAMEAARVRAMSRRSRR